MKHYISLVAGIIGIIMLAVVAQAADQTVKLEWDASISTDAIGYAVFSGDSAEIQDVRLNTDIINGTTYDCVYNASFEGTKYYHVKAYDGRNWSGASNIVSTSIDTIAPVTPGTLRIIVEGSVHLIVSGPVTIRN